RAGADRPAVRRDGHPSAGRPPAALRGAHRRVLLRPAALATGQGRDGAHEAGLHRDPAPAVTRSLRILGLLADSSGPALTLSDIARALGLAKSSTANLCLALEQGEMIQRTARSEEQHV